MRFALAATLVFVHSIAFACDCAEPPPTKKALEQAAAVFLAEVVKMDEGAGTEKLVTLKVAKSWKGIDGAKVEVSTSKSGASCGYPFKAGEKYLVYAHNGPKGSPLHVSLCSRTRTAKEAEASGDFKELGDGKAAKANPAAGLQLRLEIDEKEYDPAKGSAGKIRAVLTNGSLDDVKVPAVYDAQTIRLKSGALTLRTQVASEQLLKGKPGEQITVAVGKERQLFELPLDDALCPPGKKSPGVHWDWIKRSAPPLSPIYKTRNGGFVDQAFFQVQLTVGTDIVPSNTVELKVNSK